MTKVEDQGPASGLEHPVHFIEGAKRLREILERGAADDQVEEAIFEWNVRGASVDEARSHARILCVFSSYFYKGLADVQAGDLIRTQFAQRDAKISGPRRDFEDSGIVRQIFREVSRQVLEFVQILSRDLRVPGG